MPLIENGYYQPPGLSSNEIAHKALLLLKSNAPMLTGLTVNDARLVLEEANRFLMCSTQITTHSFNEVFCAEPSFAKAVAEQHAYELAEQMQSAPAKDPAPQEPLDEEPVTKTERQSFAKMIAQQQAQIDKLIKASNANNTGALRLCDHVLDLNNRLEKKISKDELDERSSEMRKQVLEGFAYMKDTLVKILNER
ncbi:putative orphan protein [Pseudoalteromonas translucida]|uniref:Orphan protein n=2 Tax=Pseudoalteromonas translucida TaxID=166935 RepID=Q3IGK1_PSET1|nr:putative orphan protein [Pseudoalteromonas translucida]